MFAGHKIKIVLCIVGATEAKLKIQRLSYYLFQGES